MHFLRFPFACLRDVANFTARITCVVSVFTLRTWLPCFSAAQTLRGVFNVATRGIELASLARTLTTLGRLKLRRLPESTLLTEAELSCEILFGSFGAEGDVQGCILGYVPRLAVSFVSPYCEDHRRSLRLHSGGCRTGISFGDNQFLRCEMIL